jgi:hypothetical protein
VAVRTSGYIKENSMSKRTLAKGVAPLRSQRHSRAVP